MVKRNAIERAGQKQGTHCKTAFQNLNEPQWCFLSCVIQIFHVIQIASIEGMVRA